MTTLSDLMKLDVSTLEDRNITSNFDLFNQLIETGNSELFYASFTNPKERQERYDGDKNDILNIRIGSSLNNIDENSLVYKDLVFLRTYFEKLYSTFEQGGDIRNIFENDEVKAKFLKLAGEYIIRENWRGNMHKITLQYPSKSYLDAIQSQERVGQQLKSERDRQQSEQDAEAQKLIDGLNGKPSDKVLNPEEVELLLSFPQNEDEQ